MRTLKRALVMLVTALTAVTVAPVAAHAYLPPAKHLTTQYLIAHPTSGNQQTCTSIGIDLAAGTYTVDGYFEHKQLTESPEIIYTLDLAAGRYTWEDCLVPRDLYYDHRFTLTRNANPSAPVIRTNSLYGVIWEDGIWVWGSVLTPLF
ncbi:hypothetical protein GCM10007977_052050 [Dactylosporangium sucinum]|uniref:Secreted protein n=1 Tax=Dactylosporangium sucinum TaxID=1424081 RepID=A0A917WZT6_9ACTN|nr:hypothetical protein GCM10007977_052050 [Dactylosporangium sucinum]